MKTNLDKRKIGEIVDELVKVNQGVDMKHYRMEKRFFTSRTLDMVGHWHLSGKETIEAIEYIETYFDNKFLK
jgi:hypothetical protein